MAAAADTTDRIAPYYRVVAAGVAVGLAAMLGVAAWLQPSPAGFGTHRQLGFPPCTFVALFGVRCPTCGMTTAWSHAVRGELLAAMRCSAVGTLLCGAVAAIAPWLAVSAARGRWFAWRPTAAQAASALATTIGLAVVEWVVRLTL